MFSNANDSNENSYLAETFKSIAGRFKRVWNKNKKERYFCSCYSMTV